MLKTCWMGVGLVLLGAVAALAEAPLEHPVNRFDPADYYDDVLQGQLLNPLGVRLQPTEIGKIVGAPQPAKPSEYWLGIQIYPLPPAIRAQLSLSEKQGLLVITVVPDSPAAKAGIVRHDVLLRAGDKPLLEPRQLVEAVEASKAGKLKIELLHNGKPKTVEATPVKRPEEARRPNSEMPTFADLETMQKWLMGLSTNGKAGGDGQGPLQFRFIRPGAIVPGDVLVTEPLPPNMSIVVSKEGDQPARIVVKRGDEKWELSEKEIDKLPADVRPHVQRMLGRGLTGVVGGATSLNFEPGLSSFDRMEKRLDEMDRRIDRLLKAVEKPAEQPPQK